MFQHVTLVEAGFSKLFFSHGLGDRWYIVYGFFLKKTLKFMPRATV